MTGGKKTEDKKTEDKGVNDRERELLIVIA